MSFAGVYFSSNGAPLLLPRAVFSLAGQNFSSISKHSSRARRKQSPTSSWAAAISSSSFEPFGKR